jgi:Putative metal-binding motif
MQAELARPSIDSLDGPSARAFLGARPHDSDLRCGLGSGRPAARAAPLCYPFRVRPLALTLVFATSVVACGSSHPRNLLITYYDAGSDAAAMPDGGPSGDDAAGDDASPYLGGPCVDNGQCNDNIPCTYDSCDTSAGRCLNVPDDSQCQDGLYCDGMEQCVPGHGCEPGPPVSCDDGNPCHIATCVEATKSCTYAVRDVDQDGDPDAHCVPHHDCNDLDPNVSSLHAEVCSNGIDDNCNGLIDEHPCVAPQGDTCENAVPVPGATTVDLSTVGANETFATSCSVTNPVGAQDVVAAITVPPGPNVDLEVWVTSAGIEVAVAIDATCGQASSELACGSGMGATSVRARAYDVGPGTYYAVVTTQMPGTVELQADLLPPDAPPTNVDCASAAPIVTGTEVPVSIVDPPTQLASACTASTGELTYSFSLSAPQDVRVTATTVRGSGVPVIGLRDPTCSGASDELSCRPGSGIPIFESSLAAGTYVVTVAGTAPLDANLEVDLSPATPSPPDQTCASPPAVAANGRVSVDLSNHEDAIKDECFPGGPDAAYDVALAAASDVLLVGRFPGTESAGVALDTPACDAATRLACDVTGALPRVGKRNVPAGDYRAVVTDQLGLEGTLDVLVRPTVAPTILAPGAADTCAQAQAIDPVAGGYFAGDTSTAHADYSSGCDAPGAQSAPDQVLSLDLAQPQRVVFDMEGSGYTTILNVLEGPTCPGSPVMNGCYTGFGPERSFLDMELPAGQYWIVIDGYDQGKGSWDLDVRVLPP